MGGERAKRSSGPRAYNGRAQPLYVRQAYVVRMIDYFCDGDAPALDQLLERRYLYLVFEYMDTTLWREFTRRRGLFDRQIVVRMFRDVCLGVKHLHDVGIVHMVD